MKRALLFLAIFLAIAVGYFVSYRVTHQPLACCQNHPESGMEWFRAQYHLSETEAAAIAKLHAEYRPACERMCHDVALANQKIHTLVLSSPTVTPELEAALREWAALQTTCRLAMLQHVYAVCAVMPPEEGQRYLQMALERIIAPGMEHASLVAK